MLILKASALQMRMDRHIFQFLYFANLFKIRNLRKLSLLKGDENFFLGKKFGGGS